MGPAIVPALQVGSAAAGAVGSLSAAQGEKRRSEVNAFVGTTRAIQTGNTARQDMESEIGNYRNVFATNGAPMDSANYDLLQDVRDVRGRERRILVQNERDGAADWKMQGRNAMAKGWGGFFNNAGRAAMPLHELIQMGVI